METNEMGYSITTTKLFLFQIVSREFKCTEFIYFRNRISHKLELILQSRRPQLPGPLPFTIQVYSIMSSLCSAETETQRLCILGKHLTPELHLQPLNIYVLYIILQHFNFDNIGQTITYVWNLVFTFSKSQMFQNSESLVCIYE